MKIEVKAVVKRLKEAQSQFHSKVKDKTILEDARKYAEKQKGEIGKLISSDLSKVKKFIESEKKNLDKLQKQIPSEIQRLTKYVNAQKKEFETLLKSLGPKAKKKARTKKKTASKKTTESAMEVDMTDASSAVEIGGEQ